jgi:hypothetical protein
VNLRQLAALRQQAAQLAGHWSAVEREIYDDQRARVAVACNPSVAAYLADIHNVFLPLSNAWLQLRKALRDREAMTKMMKGDNA